MNNKILKYEAIFHPTNIKILNENVAGKLKEVFYMEGLIQEAEKLNQNGRLYPKVILEPAINKYIETFINNGNSYGELDHPEYDEVKLANSSHRITKIWWKGNEVWGKFKIMDTPAGSILRKIIESGGSVGVSSRAMGDSTNELYEKTNKYVEKVTELDITCWDFVSNASTYGAYPKVVNESKQFNGDIHKYESLNNKLTNIIRILSN